MWGPGLYNALGRAGAPNCWSASFSAALRFSFALRPALRRIVCGETMTTPVGRAHSPLSGRRTSSVLGPPASLIRSELSLYGGSDPLSDPLSVFASHRSG